MLVTEKEARGLWCNKARVLEVDEHEEPVQAFPVGNRMAGGYGSRSTACYASGCMSWRWAVRWKRDRNRPIKGTPGYNPDWEYGHTLCFSQQEAQELALRMAARDEIWDTEVCGYCGEAGPPEPLQQPLDVYAQCSS